MTEFLQQLLNGLSLGAIYALIALGYTMVYGVLRFINFAHSDVFMVGAFIGYFVGEHLPPQRAHPLAALLRVDRQRVEEGVAQAVQVVNVLGLGRDLGHGHNRMSRGEVLSQPLLSGP